MSASGAAAPTRRGPTPPIPAAERRPALLGPATVVLVAGATFGIAFKGGTYGLTAREALAVAVAEARRPLAD